MIKSILVAVDGSEYTEPVMMHAIKFARSFDAKLRLISVVDIRIFEWSVYLGVDGFAPVMPSTAYLNESKQILQEKAERVLQKCVDMLIAEKIDHTSAKKEGSPREIITQEAHIADLVMLGSRGEFAKWGSRNVMGATVEAIARDCIKPLFITPKEFRQIKKILIPYDGSANSNRALPYAGDLAGRFQVELVLLTVDKSKEYARSILAEGVKYLEPFGISLQSEIRHGNVDEEILSFTENSDIDCIVMGAYGHSRIREAILGSITERVMKNTHVPLLLVK